MSDVSSNPGLSERAVRLEKRMNTMQADYRADINSAPRQRSIAIVGVVALGFAALGLFLGQRTAPQPIIIQLPPQQPATDRAASLFAFRRSRTGTGS